MKILFPASQKQAQQGRRSCKAVGSAEWSRGQARDCCDRCWGERAQPGQGSVSCPQRSVPCSTPSNDQCPPSSNNQCSCLHAADSYLNSKLHSTDAQGGEQAAKEGGLASKSWDQQDSWQWHGQASVGQCVAPNNQLSGWAKPGAFQPYSSTGALHYFLNR